MCDKNSGVNIMGGLKDRGDEDREDEEHWEVEVAWILKMREAAYFLQE